MSEDFGSWMLRIREALLQPSSPIVHRDGRWRVTKRAELWGIVGSRIFDGHLDAFKESAVEVLTERDPRFELPTEKRHVASIYGETLKHSPELRRGLAESLALLGTRPSDLHNCSQHKAEATAVLSVRAIFEKADGVLWATLDSLLPTLAEASPDEFLTAVENSLGKSPCPFDELFSLEVSGIFGANYLTGLLWALETLAWDETHFAQSCLMLAKLAELDPGGDWTNRPANSLTRIFLPWLPQTAAAATKRQAVIRKLKDEFPRIAWDVLLCLLPKQKQVSLPTRKPEWRKANSDSWEVRVGREEYLKQVEFYADLTVEMARKDSEKCIELVEHLDSLPPNAFEQAMKQLASDNMSSTSDEQRLRLWNLLSTLSSKHRRFSDADWAMNEERIEKIEEVAGALAPNDPLRLYRLQFAYGSVHIYSETSDWKSERERSRDRQQRAIQEILAWGGLDAVIQFAEEVDASGTVGELLGNVADPQVDARILPIMLVTERPKLAEFTSGYVSGRHNTSGWDWVDKLNRGNWTPRHIGQFLCYLPFGHETWNRVICWLADSESEYWSRPNTGFYHSEDDLAYAVDKYIEYGHSNAAIACLSHIIYDGKPLNTGQAIDALLNAGKSEVSVESTDVSQILVALQNDPNTDLDSLFEVELMYLPHFRYEAGRLRTLGNKLALDPAFFCTTIGILYLPEGTSPPTKDYTKAQKDRATLLFGLLDDWQILPGTQLDGMFLPNGFCRWLSQVKKISEDSGHLKVALGHVGQVLIHGPPDDDGLWIHRTIAGVLEDEKAGPMRDGFTRALYNSRGAHWVDPEGKPEKELAEKYREQAERVEIEGYVRLATALRRLAEGYDREAERIASEQEDLLDE